MVLDCIDFRSLHPYLLPQDSRITFKVKESALSSSLQFDTAHNSNHTVVVFVLLVLLFILFFKRFFLFYFMMALLVLCSFLFMIW